MPETITRDEFAGQVNSIFSLAGDAGAALVLELCQVSALRVTRRQEVFSLLFKGPLDRLLPQQIYCLQHEKLGWLDIFLVPVQRDGEAIYYEAVFNRLIPADQ